MQSIIELNRAAFNQNVTALKEMIGASAFAPVVKSNAYGHGLREVLNLFTQLPEWLCCAYLDEAQTLRDAGFKGRILIVAPVYASEFARAVGLNAEIFLTHTEHLDSWLAAPTRPKVHVKIDTGLTRQGFYPDQIPALISKLKPYKTSVVGVCTHFANVEDVLEHQYATLQLERFSKAREQFRSAGFKLLEHCSSSASTLLLPESRLDLCRIGISLYGFWPSQTTRLSYLQINAKVVELAPVMTWKTTVYALKDVPAGTYIGYGCTYKAVRAMRVAVLPVGYNDGYPRIAGNDKSYVLIRGERCPLVGRISMNLMVVDVSHLANVAVNDEVVLIGKQGDEHLHAESVAHWAQTIQYELVTRINPNIPRVIV